MIIEVAVMTPFTGRVTMTIGIARHPHRITMNVVRRRRHASRVVAVVALLGSCLPSG